MNGWRDKLNDLLEGKKKFFEEDYKIKYPCLYKIDGKKHKAQICFDTGEIFIDGQVVRKCGKLGG